MADPARGALVARLGRRPQRSTPSSSSSRSSGPPSDDERPTRCSPIAALDHWRHHLRSLRKFRPYLLTEPEEKILTEKTVSGVSAWSRLYEELLGALRVTLDGERAVARDRDGEALRAGPRRRAAPPPTRSPRRSARGSARARSSSTRSSSTSRSTTGCAGTRPGSRRATSRTRRPTRPCRRSSTPRPRATTFRSATTASRRACSGSTGSSHFDRFAPVARTRTKTSWDEARRIVVDAYADFSDEAGEIVERFFDDRWIDAPVRPDKRHWRVLRDDRPGRAPVRPHELHGRPPLDPHARARARARAARRRSPSRSALQRVDSAHDGRDGVGVRRGAHVQAAPRRRGRPAAPARPPRPAGSRTRSRRRSGRSR